MAGKPLAAFTTDAEPAGPANPGGGGGWMVKPTALESDDPPVVTLTLAMPAAAIKPAGTAASNWLALPKLVWSAAPFQVTTELRRKFDPATASVKAGPPAVAELGLMPARTGGGTVTVKDRAFVVAPLGFVSVSEAVPPAAINSGGTATVTWVVLTNVVPSGVAPHRTTQFTARLVPVSVSVNAPPPAVTEDGDAAVSVGVAGFIGMPMLFETAPPGLKIAMAAEEAEAIKLSGTVAVSWLALTHTAGRGVLFQSIVEPGAKFTPLTVRSSGPVPAVTWLGLALVIRAAGLMVNGAVLEAPPF